MKKSTLGLAGVCMYLLAAISCEIPESVTLKGSPGVHLPLGSPFDLMGTRLENYINSDKIKEMMGGGSDNNKTYEYIGPDVADGVEAYVVLYPITEMELDLQAYIDSKTQDAGTEFTYNVPDSISSRPAADFLPNGYHLTREGNFPAQNPPQNAAPLFTLVLTDMAKLVKEVTGGPFGLELDYKEDFKNYLRIKIPALGITNYIPGVVAGDKLRFVNNAPPSVTLYPQDNFTDGEINIYVITTGPCSGIIHPKMIFDWETAKIDTSDEPINDTYTIDNGELNGFFGGDVDFKEAKGYIYAGGLDDNATMSLEATGSIGTLLTNASLQDKTQPVFSNRYAHKIPAHSIDQQEFIDMTAALNASTIYPVDLEYDLTIPERTIEKAKIGVNEKIFAHLVILLPMEFIASSRPTNSRYANEYAKLGLKDLFPNLGDEDLFQRKGNDDDLFGTLTTVKFVLSNIQNDIVGGKIFIAVASGNQSGLLDLKLDNPSVEFDVGNSPLIPQFEILIKKDNSPGGAPFWLKRKDPGNDNATFDFSMAVQAKADINQTVTVPGL